MLLRTRVTIFVLAALLAIALIFAGTMALLGRTLLAQVDSQTLSQEEALWRSTLRTEASPLGALSEALSSDTVFTADVNSGDFDSARRSLAAAIGRIPTLGLSAQVIGRDGQILLRSPSGEGYLRLLDQVSIDRIWGGAQLLGLRSTEATRAMLVSAAPLYADGHVIAALAVARNAASAVRAFAEADRSETALVTLRGQLIVATDRALWADVKDRISLRRSARDLIFAWPRVLTATSLPTADTAGGAATTIVAYKDNSGPFFAILRVVAWSGGIVAALTLLVATLIHWYMKASFRPLDQAVEITRRLARGDTSVEIEATGQDEIGRLGEAVRQLRVNAIMAEDLSRQRQRSRIRRERLIRREISALADALDPEARAEVLAVLNDTGIKPGSTDTPQSVSASSNHQLRLIAGVLRDLVRRILEQRQTLTGMIADLEDALASKDKLIGLEQQLEVARQVQLAILPRDHGEDPRVAIYGRMTPAAEVGGDFYDCFMIDDDTVALVIADVSGKGVPASLFMAVTRTLIRAVARFAVDPAVLISEVNDLLARENDQLLFVTACLGFLNLTTGRFCYANAGHSPPILVGTDNSVVELPKAQGMALAVADGLFYQRLEFVVKPNDTLFFYTDGISEAQNPEGQLFGMSRLIDLLARNSNLDERLLSESIERDVRVFEAGRPATDDLTCLAVRYVGEPVARRPHAGMVLPDAVADPAPTLAE